MQSVRIKGVPDETHAVLRQRARRCGPSVLVVDASVLAAALADDGGDGDRARTRLRGEELAAPDLIDLEVTSVLRDRLAGGHLDLRRALGMDGAPASYPPRTRAVRSRFSAAAISWRRGRAKSPV